MSARTGPAADDPARPTNHAGASVVTIGKFDGVHLGHQALVRRARERAAEHGASSAALILHPHPASVLHGLRLPLLLTPEERAQALRELGVERVELVTFDADLAELSPRAFVDMLVKRHGMRGIVIGPDFRFGRDRGGDVGVLEAAGADLGFVVDVVPPVIRDGARVSSGRIRDAILEGDVGAATRWLGRPPGVRGRVVEGARRGRQLGFPTANVEPTADYAVPADGVYAARCTWTPSAATAAGARSEKRGRTAAAGVEHAAFAAVSVGIRPTFDAGPRSIEAFLIDFEGDLYGVEMRVEFIEFLRPEARFDSVADLVAAMTADVERARAITRSRGA